MQPESGIKTWQWVVTVVVIIVLIIIGVMVFGNKGTNNGDVDTVTPTTNGTTPTNQVNRIIMSDQFPGNVVYVSSIQLAQPGWVVIHKDNNGQPGDVIGSAYFGAGINAGRVNLTASTIDGMTYYAMLHSDDGDKLFDATKDLPIKDASDNIIMKVFKASATATVDIKG